jgi:hypothetical protein
MLLPSIFGVDELMNMGRTCVNLIGNYLATVVVARWEGEFDDNRAKVFGTPAEVELDLESGGVAFAEAVQQGDQLTQTSNLIRCLHYPNRQYLRKALAPASCRAQCWL